tara:strand:- start:1575 stop:1994 length:420 start_codon:yes stop_codon:yes gene_type:complete
MVVKSATKKWLLDGGMPELEALILANDRRIYAWQMNSLSQKAITEMNYEEIADFLINHRIYKNSYPNMTPELYLDLGENLQKVKKYWLQKYEEYMLENENNIGLMLEYGELIDWDVEYKPWKFNRREFMNWNENPFQTK